MKKFATSLALLCTLPLISAQSMAADTVWQFDNPSNLSGDVNGNYGWNYSTEQNSNTVNVTAFSYVDGYYEYTVPSKIGVWSGNGMGVLNDKHDQHTIDNYGRSDFLLFSFDDAVKVSDIEIGYVQHGYGSDVSIAAFDSLSETGYSSWSSVIDSAIYSTSFANVANVSPDLSSFTNAAKYWLIGAYNNVFGGNHENGYDKFKLLALTTSTPTVDVPAPATALLFGALGMLVLRRRK